MAKHLALLMIIALVLCSSLLSQAARPDPPSPSLDPKSIHSGNDQVKAMENELTETCDGKMNEEECLMRRTMIAHIDYIYTQNSPH
ncbi:hypothetical protein V2J09_021591 [Rumex salicifolius]